MLSGHVVTTAEISLSDRCNLCCSFCYAGRPIRCFDQKMIDKVFDWLCNQFEGSTPQQKKYGIRVNIYGGEPLVEWENLKKVVESKTKMGADRGVKFSFGIVTNMTLLTEDKLDWLVEHDVRVSPSIDGCAAAQDAERRFRDGTGSSAVVYENAKRLLSKAPLTACRSTISPSTVQHTYESIRFLTQEVGFKTVNMVLAGGGVVWRDEKLDLHFKQIEKVTDWWIDEMRQGRFWDLYHLRDTLNGFWSGRRNRRLCSAVIGEVGIDTAGNIYPCHRFCSEKTTPEFLLGTVDTGITNSELVEKLLQYDWAEDTKERCKDCPASIGCNSLCLHDVMLSKGGKTDHTAVLCKVMPFYWKMAMRAHNVLMAENNKMYLKKYDTSVSR